MSWLLYLTHLTGTGEVCLVVNIRTSIWFKGTLEKAVTETIQEETEDYRKATR